MNEDHYVAMASAAFAIIVILQLFAIGNIIGSREDARKSELMIVRYLQDTRGTIQQLHRNTSNTVIIASQDDECRKMRSLERDAV